MAPIRVLLVDDEPLVLKGLERLLRRTPTVEVHSRTSGEAALEALKTESFAVVVSDLKMPSMDGFRFLALANDVAPHVEQIVLTGSFGEEEEVRVRTKARHVLEKPCTAETLLKAIEGVGSSAACNKVAEWE